VLTSPYPSFTDPESGKKKTQRFSCKWNCYYCPNEPGQPRSYLHDEPAVLRANQNGFDAVLQVPVPALLACLPCLPACLACLPACLPACPPACLPARLVCLLVRLSVRCCTAPALLTRTAAARAVRERP
jgi:hypothetical protein